MNLRSIVCCVALGFAPPLQSAPVDLTPHPQIKLQDGVELPEIQFSHGTETICYRPPTNWRANGSAINARLEAANGSTIRVEITHRDNTPPCNWDEAALTALRATAAGCVPQTVTHVKAETESQSLVRLNGGQTIAFTFSGVLYSQKYEFLVLLYPVGTEQFCFVLQSEEKEFSKACEQFIASLYSMRWEKRHF